MRDIVLVPCYERPEFTWVCLEYLSRARGIQDKEVWLWRDSHVDDLPLYVPGSVDVVQLGEKLFKHFFHFKMVSHATYGNSASLVAALGQAYRSLAERIFLVEDDIMVAPDIFEWHEDVLSTAHPFVSCATALNLSAHFQINGPYAMDETYKDPSAYLQTIGPYSSHAAAFIRPMLGDLLKYFSKNQFVWEQGLEQDIRVQQFLKNGGHRSVWPYSPRAFNVGLYSYHISGMKFNGTLEEKVAALKSTITNSEKLKYMAFGNQTVTAIPSEFPVRANPVFEVKRNR